MARFNYEQYDGSIPENEVVFSTGNQYANPSGETETRKQLSTPLYQLKTFINSLFDSNDKIIPTNIPVATTSNSGTMSASDKAKLNGIESGAEANVIETVKINGTALTPSDKAVNIPNATNSSSGLMTSDEKIKLVTIEQGAQANVIETISLNGNEIVPSEKAVDISIPNATVVTDGLMSAADKKLLNNASSSVPLAGSNLVKRDTHGRFRASAPSNSADVANKQYVDDAVLGISDSRPVIVLNSVEFCANCGVTDADIGKKFVLEVDQDGNHDPIFVLAEVDV